MVVRLDKVPPPAKPPSPPSVWVWLGLLLLAALIGVGLALGLGEQSLGQRPAQFWGRALGVPLAIWSVLLFGRLLIHVSLLSSAEGWDEAREADWLARLRRGRRSQQVLAVSLHTALREEEDTQGQAQFEALTSGQGALKTQPVRGKDGIVCRHSALAAVLDETGTPLDDAAMLLRLYRRVLADLAVTLQAFPVEQPLALVLQTDSAVPPNQQQDAWKQAWVGSGIRQTATRQERQGLDAIDHWLDTRIADPALLLVVALSIAPEPPEESAEVAAGLLFGNRLTQKTLRPLAYLHRPEQERGTTTETLRYAARQALDWVPLDAKAVKQVWLAGIDAKRQGDISTVLLELPKAEPSVQDLGKSIGHPGCAAAWTAVAAAVQATGRDAQPQFIFSGESSANTGLWSTVVMAAAPSSS